MNRTKNTLMALVLCCVMALSSCMGTPDAVKQAHQEEGSDIRVVLETYASRVLGIQTATPEELAAKQREAAALEAIASRILQTHDEVAKYLASAGLFGSDAERAEFLALIRELRGVK